MQKNIIKIKQSAFFVVVSFVVWNATADTTQNNQRQLKKISATNSNTNNSMIDLKNVATEKSIPPLTDKSQLMGNKKATDIQHINSNETVTKAAAAPTGETEKNNTEETATPAALNAARATRAFIAKFKNTHKALEYSSKAKELYTMYKENIAVDDPTSSNVPKSGKKYLKQIEAQKNAAEENNMMSPLAKNTAENSMTPLTGTSGIIEDEKGVPIIKLAAIKHINSNEAIVKATDGSWKLMTYTETVPTFSDLEKNVALKMISDAQTGIKAPPTQTLAATASQATSAVNGAEMSTGEGAAATAASTETPAASNVATATRESVPLKKATKISNPIPTTQKVIAKPVGTAATEEAATTAASERAAATTIAQEKENTPSFARFGVVKKPAFKANVTPGSSTSTAGSPITSTTGSTAQEITTGENFVGENVSTPAPQQAVMTEASTPLKAIITEAPTIQNPVITNVSTPAPQQAVITEASTPLKAIITEAPTIQNPVITNVSTPAPQQAVITEASTPLKAVITEAPTIQNPVITNVSTPAPQQAILSGEGAVGGNAATEEGTLSPEVLLALKNANEEVDRLHEEIGAIPKSDARAALPASAELVKTPPITPLAVDVEKNANAGGLTLLRDAARSIGTSALEKAAPALEVAGKVAGPVGVALTVGGGALGGTMAAGEQNGTMGDRTWNVTGPDGAGQYHIIME